MMWSALVRRARSEGLTARELQRVQSFLGLDPHQSPIPLQRPNHYVPGLPTRPWHRVEDFPHLRALEENFRQISSELDALAPGRPFLDHVSNLVVSGQWRVYYFYYQGRRVESHCRQCPETARLIESIPGHEGCLAYFSRLRAGGHIRPHCGPTNATLRCHLGLRVPDGCEIRVGEETRGWEEGECLVFDDSIDHEVWNRSSQDRHVLIVDFFHPDLTAGERWALRYIKRHSWLARSRFRRMEKQIASG